MISDVKPTPVTSGVVPKVNLMSETERTTDPVPKFKVLIMALRLAVKNIPNLSLI